MFPGIAVDVASDRDLVRKSDESSEHHAYFLTGQRLLIQPQYFFMVMPVNS